MITEVLDAFPGAPVDRDNLSWYQGLLAGELHVNRCRECETWHHPPGPRCPHCWSGAVISEMIGGRGTVELRTVLHVGPAAPGIDYEAGHTLVSIRLDEAPGVRLTAPMEAASGEIVDLGSRVELRVVDRGGIPTPAARLLDRHD
jgi:uncharacterized OB-fold protein